MAAVWNTTVTNLGLQLQTKQVQGSTISFTRAVSGSGSVPVVNLREQTAVSEIQQTLNIQSLTVGELQYTLKILLTNLNLTTGYNLSQVGIYATDPDIGEILFAIAQLSDTKAIPSHTDAPGYSLLLSMTFQNDQGANIEINPDMSGYVTMSAAQDMINEATEPILDNLVAIQEMGAKNLLQNTATSGSYLGVTYTVNNDGTITANGTATGGNAAYTIGTVDVKAGQTYKLTGCPAGGSNTTYGLYLQNIPIFDYGSGKTYTPSEDKTVTVRCTVYQGATVSNLTFSPMLRLAEIIDDTYQPYAMTNSELTEGMENQGQSIDAIEANLVANQYMGAKNLLKFPYDDTLKSGYGITWTTNDDGTVTVDGTATAYTIFNLQGRLDTDTPFYLPDGDYIISGCPEGGSVTNGYRLIVGITVNGEWQSIATDTGSGAHFTYTQSMGPLGVQITVAANTAVNNLTFSPMLRMASIIDGIYEQYADTNLELTQEVSVLPGNTNKNILEVTADTQTSNGVTFTINRDSNGQCTSVTINGTASADTNCWLNEACYIPAGRYILGEKLPTNIGFMYIQNLSSYVIDNYGRKYEVATAGEYKIAIRIRSGVTANNLILRPILRKVGTTPDFVVYAKSNEELTADVQTINTNIGTKAENISMFSFDSDNNVVKTSVSTEGKDTEERLGLINETNVDAAMQGYTKNKTALGNKVDKVSGKGLSTNDYTTAEKNKLSGIEAGANKTIVDNALSDSSTNPVQNQVVKAALDDSTAVETTTDTSPYLYKASEHNAVYDKLVGGSLAVNQLNETLDNWSLNDCTKNYDSTSNVLTITPSTYQSDSVGIYKNYSYEMNHKFLFTTEVFPTNNTGISFGFSSDSNYKIINTDGNKWNKLSIIIANTNKPQNALIIYGRIQNSGWSSGTLKYRNTNIFDLTLMFGSTIADYVYSLEQATAGSGIAWLKSYGFFTKDYYPYNAGSLQSVKTSGKKVVGKNLLPLTFENMKSANTEGTWNGNVYNIYGVIVTVEIDADGFVKSINVNGKGHSSGSATIYFYKNNNGLTIPNGCKLKLNPSSTVDKMDGYIYYTNGEQGIVTANMSSDISLNGNDLTQLSVYFNSQYNSNITFYPIIRRGDVTATSYEPYTSTTYPLGNDELRGVPQLVSNQLVYDGDIKTSDGVISRRYGIVDLGSLTWNYASDWNGAGVFTSEAIADIKAPRADGLIPNILCSQYYAVSRNVLYNGTSLKAIAFSGSNNKSAYIRDSAYTDATAFKTAMSGVYLVYELATPTTEVSTPFTSPQMVYSDGTEEYIDERDVPIPVGGNREYIDIPEWMDNQYFNDLRNSDGEIKNALYENEILLKNYASKNLLPISFDDLIRINTAGTWSYGTTYTHNGISYRVSKDSSGNIDGIVVNGTATGVSQFKLFNKEIYLDEPLIFTGTPSGGSDSTYEMVIELSGWRSEFEHGDGLIITDTILDASCRVMSGYTANNLVFKPMLRRASIQDPTYEPYVPTNRELATDYDSISKISKYQLSGADFILRKQANMVSITCDSVNVVNYGIPTAYGCRPSEEIWIPARIQSGSDYYMGLVRITTNGDMYMYTADNTLAPSGSYATFVTSYIID